MTAGGVPPDIAARTGEVFWPLLRSLLASGVSVVAEWALRRGFAADHLAPLLGVADVRLVVCTAPRDVLLRRVDERAGTAARWPFPDAAVRARLADPAVSWAEFGEVGLQVPSLVVDTTNGYVPGLPDVLRFCLDSPDGADS